MQSIERLPMNNSLIASLTQEVSAVFPDRFSVSEIDLSWLTPHNVQLVLPNNTRGCIDERNQKNGRPRHSLKIPGADLTLLALEALQQNKPLLDIARLWQQQRKIIYLHDGSHGDWQNGGQKTDCGANDKLDIILEKFLVGFKNFTATNAQTHVRHLLGNINPAQRFSELMKMGAQVHEHYDGHHSATDLILNFRLQTLIHLQPNGQRHFTCDAGLVTNSLDVARLAVTTVDVLSAPTTSLGLFILR